MKTRILLVDNHDSFTHNIVALLEYSLNNFATGTYQVIPYDEFSPPCLATYSHILISPGPMTVESYPKHRDIIAHSVKTAKPLLGICLGHQSIGVYFGAKLKRLDSVAHGLCSQAFIINSNRIKENTLYKNLPRKISVGRYHSWVLDSESINSPLQITSQTSDATVMAIAHEKLPIFGIQFHPESFLTPQGKTLLKNFLATNSN